MAVRPLVRGPLMSAPINRAAHWLRSRLTYWQEWLVLLLLAADDVWVYRSSGSFAHSSQVALCAALTVAAAVLLRRGWLKLFGPVLFYDLVRLARRGRYALLRCLYAVLLFLMLLSVYNNFRAWDIDADAKVKQLPRLAEVFFFTFMIVPSLVVCLLTPAFTAGAIAEEKERRTLEFLLATDLHDREIVLGKQTARLANLTLFVLTGLPILSFMQFLGGVDPDLVVTGFAATGLTMLGLCSLSMLCSVYSRKTRNAIVLTYLTMVAYLAVSGVAKITLTLNPSVAGIALGFGEDPLTVQDAVDAFSVANPFVTLARLEMFLMSQGALADYLPELLSEYAVFYGLMTLICTTWAVLRMRPAALFQTFGTT